MGTGIREFGTAVPGGNSNGVGSYLGSGNTAQQTNYQSRLNQNFNALVPENMGKWSSNENTRDVNTMAGVQTLSGQYTDVARVYLASRSLYTRRILIPGSLPFIIAGLRLTYGVGWRVIVGAEMISSIIGLGFLIDDARWQLRPDIMICGMITIAMIGWVSENWFFDWVERRTIERWGMKAMAT